MRVGCLTRPSWSSRLTSHRIVEYATRDQAQQAVNTLSNQNLMGRLVYVREVRKLPEQRATIMAPPLQILPLTRTQRQDREAEPRFTGPPPARGSYDAGPPRGGYAGNFAMGGGPPSGGGGGGGGGGRQIFINNVRAITLVCSLCHSCWSTDDSLTSFRTMSAGKISRIYFVKQVCIELLTSLHILGDCWF